MAQEYTDAQMAKLNENIGKMIDGFVERGADVPPFFSAYLHTGADGTQRWAIVQSQSSEDLGDGWLPVHIGPPEAE